MTYNEFIEYNLLKRQNWLLKNNYVHKNNLIIIIDSAKQCGAQIEYLRSIFCILKWAYWVTRSTLNNILVDSMKLLPRKVDEFYVYSLKMGGKFIYAYLEAPFYS
jgi:hypothetical protein